MEIYNCKKIIVLKYVEILSEQEDIRAEYTRYICIPYTVNKSRHIKSYLHLLKGIIDKDTNRRVKCKFITGQKNINEYLQHLKCKVTKLADIDSEEIREPSVAKIYGMNERLPHEDVPEFDIPHIFQNTFGEHFIADWAFGVNIRKL